MVGFLFLWLSMSAALSPIASDFRQKAGVVNGETISLAQWDIEFDEDLYVLQPSSCSSSEPPLPTLSCENLCDYTEAQCGESKASLFTEFPSLSGCTSAACDASKCEKLAWETARNTLEVGEWSEVISQRTDPRRVFRAFITETSGYRVSVNSFLGVQTLGISFNNSDPEAALTTDSLYSSSDNSFWNSFGATPNTRTEICPEDPGFSLGTVYILVGCLELGCEYEIKIEKLSRGTGPVLDECSTRGPGPECIEAGKPVTYSEAPGTFHAIVHYVNVEECVNDRALIGLTMTVGYWGYWIVAVSFEGIPSLTYSPFNNDGTAHNQPIPEWTNVGTQGPAFVAFSFPCDEVPPVMFISLLPLANLVGPLVPGKLTVQTDPAAFTLSKLSVFAEWSFPWWAISGASIECPDGLHSSCVSGRYTQILGGGTVGTVERCSQYINFPKPTDHTNLFFPPFSIQDIYSSTTGIEDYPQDSVPSPRTLTVTYLTSISSTSLSLAYGYNMPEECQIKLRGILVDSQYGSFRGSVPNSDRTVACDLQAFVNHSDYINALIQETTVSEESSRLRRLGLDIDASGFENIFTDCFEFAETNIYQPVPVVATQLLSTCLDSSNTSDDCCSPQLRASQCCSPFFSDVNETVFVFIRDESNIIGNCSADCFSSFASELTSLLDPDRCVTSSTSLTETLRTSTVFWTTCVETVFQRDNIHRAFPCFTDSDCPYSTCNLFTRQCVVDEFSILEAYFDDLVDCLMDSNIPPFILTKLIPDLETRSADVETQINYIKEAFSKNSCVSKNTWDFGVFPSWEYYILCSDACVVSEGIVPRYLYPFLGAPNAPSCRISSTCGADSTPHRYYDPACTTATDCSMDGVDVDACDPTPVCAVCEDPLSCRPVDGVTSESECDSAEVCVDHEGNLVSGVSKSECETSDTYGGCYFENFAFQYEPDPFCTGCTKEQCLSTSPCELEYYIPASSTGACLVLLNQYFDTKDCPSAASEGRFPPWQSLPNQACLAHFDNEADCLALNGYRQATWVERSSACTDFELCLVDYYSSRWRGGEKWATTKDDGECSDCYGNRELYFKQAKRVWIPGVARTPTWHTPEALPVAEIQPLFDYNAFGATIENAVSEYYQFQLRTLSNCLLVAPGTLLIQSLCECDYFSEGVDACGDSVQGVTTGAARICTGFETALSLKPAYLNFPNNSVSIEGECVSIETGYVSALYYQTTQVPLIASVWYLDPIIEDTFPAVNDGEAIVGVIVSNGTRVEIKGTAYLQNWTICFLQERFEDQIDADLNIYNVYDIGYALDGDNLIRPLGLVAYLEVDRYGRDLHCAEIPELRENTTFALVLRDSAENWADFPKVYLGLGEQIYIGVIGVIYMLVWLLGLVVLYHNRKNMLFLMYFYLCVLVAWRGIHLLVTAGSVGAIQSTGLSEPPIFFLFAAVGILAIKFQLIRAAVKSTNTSKLYEIHPAMIIFSIGLFAILLAVILIAQLVEDGDVRIKTCYNRIDGGLERWPASALVFVVYLCVLGVLGVICGSAIAIAGYQLKRTQDKLSTEAKAATKYFYVALLLAGSVLCFITHLLIFGNIFATRTIIWLRLTLLYTFELLVPVIVFVLALRRQHKTSSGGTGGGKTSKSKEKSKEKSRGETTKSDKNSNL